MTLRREARAVKKPAEPKAKEKAVTKKAAVKKPAEETEFMDRPFRPKGQFPTEDLLTEVSGEKLIGEDFDVLKAQLGPNETLGMFRTFKDTEKKAQCLEISDRTEFDRLVTEQKEKLETYSFWKLPAQSFAR